MTNISSDILAILQKPTTKVFLEAAQDFVKLVEDREIAQEDFYKKAHTALINLYLAGHHLEEIPLIYSGPDYECEKSDEELFINENIQNISRLGDDAFYWEIHQPTYIKENEQIVPVQGWLVDDFTSIYRDLKVELSKIELKTDNAIEDALWQLRFGFYHDWGIHCIDAMRAMHYLWYDGKIAM